MYISPVNLMADKLEVIEFLKRFSFATIITAKDNQPVATHLPFLVNDNGENIILTSHFAKANSQWKDIETSEVLVIFTEPHAYISPKNYEKELNVPTWNYIAVHCYGKAAVVNEPGKLMQVIDDTINHYEAAYKEQWDRLPEDFKAGMAKGIVAFEIKVTDIQGKKKLSQNKTAKEQATIIDTLSNSEDSNEKIIADYMKMNQAMDNC
ncbi:MAG: FMN-binding negative transcriptional regulator [Rhizobacter sp.]|nr:FMN-binding negative transcriptional regulator [Ferruginibacter sp.]